MLGLTVTLAFKSLLPVRGLVGVTLRQWRILRVPQSQSTSVSGPLVSQTDDRVNLHSLDLFALCMSSCWHGHATAGLAWARGKETQEWLVGQAHPCPFILAIVAALMVWPKIEMEISQKRFAPQTIDRESLKQAATENRLTNAKFSSVDAKGRPFSILSTQATQDSKNPDIIHLQAPSGTLKMSDTVNMTAESKTGLYQQKDQQLTLNDDVVLTRTDGTVMNTNVMYVNLMTNDINAPSDVKIDGPQGELTAKSMTMRDSGAVTVFEGPAKLILKPKNSINPKGGT